MTGLRIAVGLAGLVVALAGCGTGQPTGSPGPVPTGRLGVVASTTVIGDIVAQVGGPLVAVHSVVPKGGEVHTYDPSPSDLQAVAEARLVVMNGLGLDDWIRQLVADSGSTATIVALAPDLPGVEYVDGDSPDEPVNPHLWLDVRNGIRYAERIGAALEAADPANGPAHRAGTAAYVERLTTLDGWVRQRIAEIPPANRRIVSFHEAFPYFARAYGLEIVGTVVHAPGQDPSAAEIAALVEAIRSSGARAIFSEAQFNDDLVRTIADETGAIVESDLYNDSLGDAPVDTYEGLISWDVDRIVEALR